MTDLPVWIPRPDEDPMKPPPPGERVSYSRTTIDRVSATLAKALGGTDVPPADLPAQIKTLAELLEQARHQARTLAGDVASLTNRLDDELPRIFDTVLDELADDLATRQVEIQAADVHEVGIAAFRLALRLVTDHELRDRDSRPRRLDCGCDPQTLGAVPHGPGDVWTCPHSNRWRADVDGSGDRWHWRPERDAEFLADHPVLRPSSFVIDPTVDGGDYFTHDTSKVVRSDGLTVDNTSPASVPSHPAVGGIPDVVDYDRDDKAVALWGIPLELDGPRHPAVAYLDDVLHGIGLTFAGCDDSVLCRGKIITQALRDHLSGVEMGLAGHDNAVENVAAAIYGPAKPDPRIGIGAVKDAVRMALTYGVLFPTSDRTREQARG